MSERNVGKAHDGGAPAFPVLASRRSAGEKAAYKSTGLSIRDYLIAHSPITESIAREALGSALDLTDADARASFFACWAHLQFEFAQAQLAIREEAR